MKVFIYLVLLQYHVNIVSSLDLHWFWCQNIKLIQKGTVKWGEFDWLGNFNHLLEGKCQECLHSRLNHTISIFLFISRIYKLFEQIHLFYGPTSVFHVMLSSKQIPKFQTEFPKQCLKSDFHLPQNFILFTSMIALQKWSKNAFYFILKVLFVFNIFKFLSWLFEHVEKRLD